MYRPTPMHHIWLILPRRCSCWRSVPCFPCLWCSTQQQGPYDPNSCSETHAAQVQLTALYAGYTHAAKPGESPSLRYLATLTSIIPTYVLYPVECIDLVSPALFPGFAPCVATMVLYILNKYIDPVSLDLVAFSGARALFGKASLLYLDLNHAPIWFVWC